MHASAVEGEGKKEEGEREGGRNAALTFSFVFLAGRDGKKKWRGGKEKKHNYTSVAVSWVPRGEAVRFPSSSSETQSVGVRR